MIDKWMQEIKKDCPADMLGMILCHNGIVRATAKNGGKVGAMNLSYDKKKLEAAVREFKKRDGIVEIRAWINEGHLKIGDDIMYVCVAGRFRKDVLPVFQELITMIKTEIVSEDEM
ncbi:MAG: molybdopterin converting factor [Deltaproteobacteria bacterium HGW-Deltaproteobacteria-13]|jgi:molybdopterin synthase catalytic subunit|nr:MAG: molybdopterin converting factor [Deltaproteobacteria bacterium HGW-Deltaproteobacteria-13]